VKPDSDQQQLLHDVLTEASQADFREASLRESLRLAGRRRRWRQARRSAAILGVTLFAGWLAWHPKRAVDLTSAMPDSHPGRLDIPTSTAVQLVQTRAFSPESIVTTMGTDDMGPAVFTVAEIASSNQGYHVINDSELLALIAPTPALLIRLGPGSEELILADGRPLQAIDGH
jgi:hypothetical protein